MEDLKDIIDGCIRGEHKYQKIIYERYYGFALKTIFRYIYKYEKAVDVANDGFVKVFRAFNHFECHDWFNVEKVLIGWVKKIMINTAIDQLRKHNLIPEIGGMPEYVWEEADRSQSADQKVLYKELIAHVKNLPPSYRIVFNMAVIDGYSHQEIADALGISVGTSKSNLFKAKAQLQKAINKENNSDYGEIDLCSL